MDNDSFLWRYYPSAGVFVRQYTDMGNSRVNLSIQVSADLSNICIAPRCGLAFSSPHGVLAPLRVAEILEDVLVQTSDSGPYCFPDLGITWEYKMRLWREVIYAEIDKIVENL